MADSSEPLDMSGLRKLFDELDNNTDGKVSSKEWGHSVGKKQDILSLYFGGITMKQIGVLFNSIDTDGNDSLSWSEICNASTLSPLMKLYLTLDKDKDHKVSSKEWGQAVGKNFETMAQFFGGKTKSDVGKMWHDVDANNDDTISWGEIQDSVYGPPTEFHELEELFKTLDKDNNGVVSSKEWGQSVSTNKEIMGKFFGGVTPQQIGPLFNSIDENKDKKLSWDEIRHGAILGDLMAFFFTLDKNGDGQVSSKEWGQSVGSNYLIMGKYFGGSTKKEVGQMFNSVDADKDDVITWREVQAAAAKNCEHCD